MAALVEKLTNSIDAILMRRCYESGIDPKSPNAPRSVEEAVGQFYPNHKSWDLRSLLNQQAELSAQCAREQLKKGSTARHL